MLTKLFHIPDFSNIVPRTDIKLLAECDESESVREMKEIYADYLCVNPSLFSMNLPTSYRGSNWHPDALQRSVNGLTALLLSLKLKPTIRATQNSPIAAQLANAMHEQITKETALFDFRTNVELNGRSPPLLIIIDRRDDPVTPLLTQWTYQAMVHELLGINNNRVNLSNIADRPKDLLEVVLSLQQDDFYRNVSMLSEQQCSLIST